MRRASLNDDAANTGFSPILLVVTVGLMVIGVTTPLMWI